MQKKYMLEKEREKKAQKIVMQSSKLHDLLNLVWEIKQTKCNDSKAVSWVLKVGWQAWQASPMRLEVS